MQRPESVPAEATYLEAWEGLLPDQAAPAWGIGTGDSWRVWRVDGSVLEESAWRDGQRHGTTRRYHEDGSLGSLLEYADGRVVASTFHRTSGPTTEPNFDDLPASIRSVVNEYDAGDGMLVRQTYRTADGVEVDQAGEPLPPRPAGVPEQAVYGSAEGRWVTARSWLGQRSGLARYWTVDGTPTRVEYYRDGEGVAAIDHVARFRGNPLIEAARAGDGGAVEECLRAGLGASPGAAWHAAHEGLPELALRLAAPEPGELVDPRVETERPEHAPAGAVWVAGLGQWVSGELDEETGVARGTWHLYSDGSFDQVDFVDGRRVARREYYTRRPDQVHREYRFDRDGNTIFERSYEAGVPTREKEELPDGASARREFHPDGALLFERVERDGELVLERWFTTDGQLAAEVRPRDADTEWWRAVDAEGALIAEGPVEAGRAGEPLGTWRLAGGEAVSFDDFPADRRFDLGPLAVALHTWRAAPAPEALAGVDDVDWASLETFYGASRDLPFLLKGLAVADELAFRTARGRLTDAIFHQHTLAEAGGPAYRFLTALVPVATRPESLLALLVRVATRDGHLGATRFLKSLFQSVPADADKPERYYTKRNIEAAYHEVYASLTAAAPVWAELAATGSTAVRRWAVCLLAAADGAVAAEALGRRLVDEPDVDLRAEILLGLALHEPDAATLEPFVSGDEPLLRFAAALTWARLGLPPAGPVARTLLDGLTGRLDPAGFGELYLGAGDPATDAAITIARLPREQAVGYVADLCAALDAANALDAVRIARALLDVAFPTAAYTEAQELDGVQRTVVRAIADAKSAWLFEVDLHEVLRYNALPCDPDALRALV